MRLVQSFSRVTAFPVRFVLEVALVLFDMVISRFVVAAVVGS